MKKLSPIKAIRAKCMDCSNNQPIEIKECPIQDCPLYYYRMGTDPSLRGKRNTTAGVEALKKYRESQTTNKRKEAQNVNT